MSTTAPTTGPAAAAAVTPDVVTPAAADGTPDPAAADGVTPPAGKELTAEQLVEKNRKANSEAKALRDRNKTLEADLKEFTAWKESQKTEEQRITERQQALEAENAQLKRAALIARVQATAKLPDELLTRLRGETEEELLADAKALAALIVPPAPVPLAPNPGQRIAPGSESTSDPRQTAAKAWLNSLRG